MTTLRLALAVGVVTTMIIAVSESAVLDPAKHPGDLVDSSQSQVSPAQDQSRDDLTLALAELNDSNEDLSDEPLPQVSTDAHIREKRFLFGRRHHHHHHRGYGYGYRRHHHHHHHHGYGGYGFYG